MYGQLIQFIVVIFIYGAKPVGPTSIMSATGTFSLFLVQLGLFFILCREYFKGKENISGFDYWKRENRLKIIAIFLFAFTVYGLDIKYFIKAIPLVSRLDNTSEVLGFLIYFIYLVVIWLSGHRSYENAHRVHIPPLGHLMNQARFCLGMLIPWCFLLAFFDLTEMLLPWNFCYSSVGHLVIYFTGLLFFFFFGTRFVLKVWNCKPFRLFPRRKLIEDFFREHRFKVKDILLWPLSDGNAVTAGIVGFIPNFRYIVITPALNALLEDRELLAVMAHEMGHIRKKHMILYLAVFMGYIATAYMALDVVLIVLVGQDFVFDILLGNDLFSTTMLAFYSATPFLVLMIVYLRFVFGYFSRNCERQADLYARTLMGTSLDIINSLVKIAFVSGVRGDESNWHHYSIKERVNFLRLVDSDPLEAKKHDVKLIKAFKTFIVFQCCVILFGATIRNTSWFEGKVSDLNVRMVGSYVGQSWEDPKLYAAYGGYLIEKKRYKEAEQILRKALYLFPDNPEVLNNIAWLYATAPPPIRNPDKAVGFAKKALHISPESAHIWDTLAEAYYAKHAYGEALDAINKALSMANSSREYYLDQKRKIQRALEKDGESH